MTNGATVDDMVDEFDKVRKRLKPTNGECLAVFAVLAADVIAESGPIESRLDLMRPVVALMEVRANSDNVSLERQALLALFRRCGLAVTAMRTPRGQ